MDFATIAMFCAFRVTFLDAVTRFLWPYSAE